MFGLRYARPMMIGILMTALLGMHHPAAVHAITPLAADSGAAPLLFIPNAGQYHSEAQFAAQALGGQVYFTSSAVVMALPQAETDYQALAVRFMGANRQPFMEGIDRLPTHLNYLRGADPARWTTRLATYAGLVYHELYPGVDARYDGAGGVLKGTFIVAPQADPAQIRWSYVGAAQVEMNETGDLHVYLPDGSILIERAPTAWQDIGGQRIPVAARFVRQGAGFGLTVGAYDPSYALLLDPVLEYSTFIGGSSRDVALGVAVDSAGYVYVAGLTDSADFPITLDPVGETLQGVRDAFVMKLNPNATGAASLVWATYLGGTHPETQYSYYGMDEANGIAIDDSGNIYVTGTTRSIDFPVTANAFMPAHPPTLTPVRLAFMSKLSNDGADLLYSTYLGGSVDDIGLAVAADNAGHVYVGGITQSLGQNDTLKFPTTLENAFDPTGTSTAPLKNFISKFDTHQSGAASLAYSTFLGGTNTTTTGMGLDADDVGNVYITGMTEDPTFPTTATAYQRTINTDPVSGNISKDAFVSQLDTTQSGAAGLVYSTFLGGGQPENWGDLPNEHYPRHLSPDISVADSMIYVTGYTASPNFPVVNGFQPVKGGDGISSNYPPRYDAFVARINPQKSGTASLEYSSFLGGTQFDAGTGIAATRQGNVYVTGSTVALNFPLRDAIQGQPYGTISAFAVKIDTNLNGDESLVYSTYIGRNSVSYGGIVVDALGTAYIVGGVNDAGFPVVSGFQPTYGGATDGFLVKLAFRADLQVTKTLTPDPAVVGEPMTITINVKNKGPETATAIFLTEILPSTVLDFVSATATQGECDYVTNVLRCSLGYLENQQAAVVTINLIPNDATLFPPPEGMVSAGGALPTGDLPTALATADGVEQDVNAADNSAEKSLAVYTFDTFVPTLLEPPGTTSNTRPVFRWQPIPGAVVYELQLDRVDLDTAATMSVSSSVYQPTIPLLTAAYHWRVRGVNNADVRTAWSVPGVVVITAPNTAAPRLNFFEAATVPLSWNQIPWATGYQLHIAHDAAFTRLVAPPIPLPASSLAYTFIAPSDGLYYWRVQALKASGAPGAWSATGVFVVEQ